MLRTLRAGSGLMFALVLSACSSMAPQYSPSVDNVQAIKKAGNVSAKVGNFSASQELTKSPSLSLRGSSVVSPYDGSYANYLAEAIRQEFSMAGKLSPGANVEISGMLLKNDVDASGVTKGYGEIEARIIVKKNGGPRYDKIKAARSEWESSFAGPVAIPKAKSEYPLLVQKFLAALYADPEFLRALE